MLPVFARFHPVFPEESGRAELAKHFGSRFATAGVAKIANFDSMKAGPETDRSSKSGARAGFFVDLVDKESEIRLVGWGARIRTAKWPIPRPPSRAQNFVN